MKAMGALKRIGLLIVPIILLTAVSAQAPSGRAAAIMAALRGREFEKALQLLQPALQESPRSAQLWTFQALAHSGTGHQKEALASYRNALKFSPDYLPALEGAAQLEFEAGSAEAAPLLQHVLRLQPNEPTSHAMLAVLSYKKGDCTTATQHFKKSGP